MTKLGWTILLGEKGKDDGGKGGGKDGGKDGEDKGKSGSKPPEIKIIISTEINGRTIAQRTEKVPLLPRLLDEIDDPSDVGQTN